MSTDVAGPPPNEPTYPCSICTRKFVKAVLAKHEPICRKQANKKRKTFDAGKQRAAGSDVPLASVRKVQKEIEKNDGVFRPPKTHWRERHEQFVSSVRAAKGVDHALKTGSPLPPPPKSHVPSDYVKCDYCGRNFAQNAAERHIPFCKEKNARNAPVQRKAPPPPKPAMASVSSRKPETNSRLPAARGESPARGGNRAIPTNKMSKMSVR